MMKTVILILTLTNGSGVAIDHIPLPGFSVAECTEEAKRMVKTFNAKVIMVQKVRAYCVGPAE